MKNISPLSIIKFFFFCNLFVAISCDLKLQKPYEFDPEVPELANFKNQTAWDWIQTQTSTPGTTFAGEKFDYLIQAIKLTGLEGEFSKSGDNRTFLLLNNTAFTGSGKIIVLLTGSTTGSLDKADKTRLTNLLKYHIIDAYVDQIKALPTYRVSYEFKTLLDGPNGIIKILRDELLRMSINSAADLPSTKKTASVHRHNYVFSNGIGHILNTYVGITAF